MSVAVWVGARRFEIGSASFLKAWFSTIVLRLEGGRWGDRFPAIMRDLYGGFLPAEKVPQALAELGSIRGDLAALAPEQVVWDFEDRGARPPWGNAISPHITSLANYFVSSDGKDLFDVLSAAFAEAARSGRAVSIS